MKSDTSYLRRINRAWYFRIKVPIAVRDSYAGREILELPLKTRELDEANIRKLQILAKVRRDFAGLRQVDPLNRKAAVLRMRLRELAGRDDPFAEAEELHIGDMVDEQAREMVAKHAVPIERARAWAQYATTTEATISELLDQWLAAARYQKQTAWQHRQSVKELLVFLGGDVLPSAVTGDLAADYVLKLKERDAAYNTNRRKLNSLHALWDWMSQHRIVPRGFNPWGGFRLAKRRRDGASTRKRGYNDSELIALFGERPDHPHLVEVMVIALYTGARLDEICRLTAGDIEVRRTACLLRIRKSKTAAGIRSVVICAPLAIGVVKALIAASSSGSLFPDLRGGGYDDKLSWASSKAFGRFRDKRGLSRETDFHSFRRTVITILENKRVHAGHVASFVGHEGGTLARDVYWDGPAFKELRDVARRIVYHKPVEKAVAVFLTKQEA